MPDKVQFAILDTLYDELTAAATAGDSERYASLFVETGALMPPGAPVVAGRTAVRDWVDRFLKEYDLQVATFTVDGSCDWGHGCFLSVDGDWNVSTAKR